MPFRSRIPWSSVEYESGCVGFRRRFSTSVLCFVCHTFLLFLFRCCTVSVRFPEYRFATRCFQPPVLFLCPPVNSSLSKGRNFKDTDVCVCTDAAAVHWVLLLAHVSSTVSSIYSFLPSCLPLPSTTHDCHGDPWSGVPLMLTPNLVWFLPFSFLYNFWHPIRLLASIGHRISSADSGINPAEVLWAEWTEQLSKVIARMDVTSMSFLYVKRRIPVHWSVTIVATFSCFKRVTIETFCQLYSSNKVVQYNTLNENERIHVCWHIFYNSYWYKPIRHIVAQAHWVGSKPIRN